MPRKAFIADIAAAADTSIPSIISVTRGDDDGDVNFCFVPASGEPIEIGILATDVPGYPAENTYMIFTKSENCPPKINKVLERLGSSLGGKTIPETLELISSSLRKVLESGSQEYPVAIDSDNEMDIDEDFTDEDDEDASDDGFGPFDGLPSSKRASNIFRGDKFAEADLNKRIRQDLREVKSANFKLGILAGMRAGHLTSLISISIHVSKLGLSDEAMRAWDLEARHYIVLLIQYSSGYKTFESIIAEPAKLLDISFRIGFSNKYKPTLDEALAAFAESPQKPNLFHDNSNATNHSQHSDIAGFNSLFISSSLNEFMKTEFISLLKIRKAGAVGWDGAKQYLDRRQGRLGEEDEKLDMSWCGTPDDTSRNLPAIVSNDHLHEASKDNKNASFPLIAAQFAVRYLVRCTEFCLVCHDRLEGEFEALKPYVCSKPLCLYQYMSLGFGPSIEHEILTQPYVVDLLVSFCYSSVKAHRLREYPTGMALIVPQIDSANLTSIKLPAEVNSSISYNVNFDASTHSVEFTSISKCPVHCGNWIVVRNSGICRHYRVDNTSMFPKVFMLDPSSIEEISPGRIIGLQAPQTQAATPPPEPIIAAELFVYDRNFDNMEDEVKAETIAQILETLPSVKEMRTYLHLQSRTATPKLANWKQRVSPAAVGVLRWIIASNRSCIVQVDKCPGQDDSDSIKIRPEQKVTDVSDEWLQFRFAQGAPDKEQRFLNSLKEQRNNLDPLYPTLFAFHGSPLGNWHSIIRQGLDFKETIHGRAYGHGVYHAQSQQISVSYASSNCTYWPNSTLKIQSAMSLNEIVNYPKAYQSSNPYLVVQHVDWIQCRYLFVRTVEADYYVPAVQISETMKSGSTIPQTTRNVMQDPLRQCTSTLNKVIGVPISTLSVSKTFRSISEVEIPPKAKRPKLESSDSSLPSRVISSDESDTEDITFLMSDIEIDNVGSGKGKEKSQDDRINLVMGPSKSKPQADSKLTEFKPGSLDQSSLPMLQPPSYATTIATMSLNRELKKILKIQKSTPLHELGWYINQELLDNIYQWIVELHSFDVELPLAQDMKKAGVSSIVLEIRFGKDFPHSPPFVRVIRPRFLPFTSGGGGHVTGGGAMCMELLTNSGWSAVNSIESVLLQVRMAIMNLEPRPARLQDTSRSGGKYDYGTSEAVEAYIRACRTHGWEVPKDFNDFSMA